MRAWFVAALAAVCLAGCAPVAHVELEDGTFVSLVPPKEAFDGTLAPEAATADFRKPRREVSTFSMVNPFVVV